MDFSLAKIRYAFECIMNQKRFVIFFILLAINLCVVLWTTAFTFLRCKDFTSTTFISRNNSFIDEENQNESLPKQQNISLARLRECFVVVTVCARNVEQHIPLFQQNIKQIVSVFKDYRILFGESDSSDETLTSLQKWAANDAEHIIVEAYGNMLKYISDRAVRIAYCRNHLLETARKNGWLAKAAYYLVLDVDVNANNILTLQNFLTNFEYDLSDWDVMTASQVMGYYDIWALRTKKVVNYDCWKMVGYIEIS
ncbi:unnamed protein product [Didymodactylos carnosus]|uniref:Uncharacterized protein n=1 Tax=Didymodactylos carnosus TaxID=1234261 RepID=A0A814ZCE9_9BILA|nr:unnamed protein product [Didymodactylos carnosus]CAF4005452.1 unnamed protein product [Didymodactylos carnosus]